MLAEMRDQLADYKRRAEELADAEWQRNPIPGDVKLALRAVAGQMHEVLGAIETCGVAVESHIPAENFTDKEPGAR
jgi:hypothetical protein